MTHAPNQFKTLTVPGPEGWSLQWEYLGEGFLGDYNEKNPEDQPLLRATLLDPEGLNEFSYCTLAPTSTPESELVLMAKSLFSDFPVHRSAMERWTWTTGKLP